MTDIILRRKYTIYGLYFAQKGAKLRKKPAPEKILNFVHKILMLTILYTKFPKRVNKYLTAPVNPIPQISIIKS